MRARIDGAWRDPERIRVSAGGTWRIAKRASVYASGAWWQYYIGAAPLVVEFVPSSDDVSGSGSPVTTLQTPVLTGGLSPFSYAWTVVSFTGISPTILNGTSATATLRQGLPPGGEASAVFRCTVTDSAAQTDSADISITFTRT